jgi:hypothetical protein
MPQRVMHVKRVHQLVRNDDDTADVINGDIWLDVLRIDRLPVTFQGASDGKAGQIVNYKLIWNDDLFNPAQNVDASNADIQFENANARRKTEQIEIRDPAAKTGDNLSSVYLWIVDKIKVAVQGKNDGTQGQNVLLTFNNLPFDRSKGNPSNRTTSVIKIVNNDLDGLKMTNSDGYPIIMDWDTYLQALQNGNVDPTDGLFLTVEYTDKFTVQFGADADTGAEGQNIVFNLAGNRNIENLFFQGSIDATDVNGETAVIRLDPFQAIVNVGSNIIAVEFAPGKK